MASLDMTLLRIVRKRADYFKFEKKIPLDVLDERTRIVFKDFGKFFREFTDVDEITHESFFTWFKMFAHPTLKGESLNVYDQLLSRIDDIVPEGLREGLMARLVAAETSNNLLKLVEKYNEGEEIDLGASLKELVEQYDQDTNRKVKQPWVQDDIADLLEADLHDTGLHFRLPCLNESLRPLRAGDFVIVAARPDVGKTTFFTSELTYMAPQIDTVFPNESRCILWFNNEGLGKRIKTRLYQSALDASIGDLLDAQKKGKLHQSYADVIAGGNLGRASELIRIMDVHDFWNHEVEDIIRDNNPALVVFDMIDNIRFGGSANNNGQRTDQLLEAMYQWGRVLGVKHDCAVMATSQVSADGENMQYPLLGMLKDSKTGKQGAADVIITIGYQADFPDARFIGTTKNKLAREGAPKSPRAEVVFDGTHGRYRSIRESVGMSEES
jgi:replicative DNA helicase